MMRFHSGESRFKLPLGVQVVALCGKTVQKERVAVVSVGRQEAGIGLLSQTVYDITDKIPPVIPVVPVGRGGAAVIPAVKSCTLNGEGGIEQQAASRKHKAATIEAGRVEPLGWLGESGVGPFLGYSAINSVGDVEQGGKQFLGSA